MTDKLCKLSVASADWTETAVGGPFSEGVTFIDWVIKVGENETGGGGDKVCGVGEDRFSGPARSSFSFCKRPVRRSVFDDGAGSGGVEGALGLRVAVDDVSRRGDFRGIINFRRFVGLTGGRGVGGVNTEKGMSLVGVRGKGKESDEERCEGDQSNDGRLWLDETIDVSESEAVLRWGGGKEEGGSNFECVEGRPRPNGALKLDGGRASPSFDVDVRGARSSIVFNTCEEKNHCVRSKTDKVTGA